MRAKIASLILLLTSGVTNVLLGVALVPTQWLTQEFTLDVPGNILRLSDGNELDPILDRLNISSAVFDQTIIPTQVNAELGIFRVCSTTTLKIFSFQKTDSKCTIDDAKDWQEVALGLFVGGLVFSNLEFMMSFMATCVKKFQRRLGIKVAIALANFVAGALVVATLIMYVMNKKIQVKPPLPTRIDFDLGWVYLMTGIAACLRALLILFNILHLIWYDGPYDRDNDSFTYKNKVDPMEI